MLDAKYVITTAVALLVTLLFRGKLVRWGNALFAFDAIGLGLFTIVGISVSMDAGLPFWVCVVMGGITGTVGGVFRDVLINEIPLIFRRDIYAIASITGGIVYFICFRIGVSMPLSEVIAALTVIDRKSTRMKSSH